MKTHFSSLALALTVILLIALSVSPAAAQSSAPAAPRLITVSGEAQVNVVPDEVVLTLGVETSNKNLQQAKRANDERVKQVIAAAQGFGVAAKDIKTDHINIEPRYRSSYEQSDFIGFFVRQTIVMTLKDVSRFDDLLSGVLEAGANYVHGIQFQTTELRKYRDQARSLAIKAAREKATALAQELDQGIGKPHSIQEEQNSVWSPYGSWWGGGAASMTQNVIQNAGGLAPQFEGALAPGQISVTAKVSVSFELE